MDITTIEIEGACFDIEYFEEVGQKGTMEQDEMPDYVCIENVYHAGCEMPSFICEHISEFYYDEIVKTIKEDEFI